MNCFISIFKLQVTSYKLQVLLATFCLLLVAFSCKKPCELPEKEGYKIIGNDKNCYYEAIGGYLEMEITSVANLKNKLADIEKSLSGGKTVALKMMNQLIVDKPDFPILNELGGLMKTYGRLTIDLTADKIGPAKSGIMITYGEWDEWNKLPFGANNTSGGAKGGELFVIPGNQEEDFKKGGQGEGSFTRGAPVVEINTHADLHSAPAQILVLGAMYPEDKPLVQFCTDLDLDAGDDMNAVEMLTVGQPLKDRFEFYETQVKQSWANDSVPVSCASVLFVMNSKNILAASPLGEEKYAFIQYVGTNSLDSVPNNQFVRIAQRNSDQLDWSRFVPNSIDIVHEWIVSTISQQIYSMWQRDIKLVPTAKKGAKNEMQNVVGCNEQFLDYYEAPAGPAKAGVSFRLIADEDIILGKYESYPPSSGPNPLSNNKINYGHDNFGGQKLEASWFKANGDSLTYPVSPQGGGYTLNAQTDRNECKANDGKIILGTNWLRNQFKPACGIRGTTTVAISNCKLYLDDPVAIDVYNFHMENGGNLKTFLVGMGLVAIDNSVDVILELPDGKQPFGIYGQVSAAPKRGGQKPNAQYVKYQNQKTTFAGFRDMLNGKGSK